MITHTPLSPFDHPPIPPVPISASGCRPSAPFGAMTLLAIILLVAGSSEVSAQSPAPAPDRAERDRVEAIEHREVVLNNQLDREVMLRKHLERLSAEGEDVREVIETQRDQIRILEEELKMMREELKMTTGERGDPRFSNELIGRVDNTLARIQELRLPNSLRPPRPAAPPAVPSIEHSFPGLGHDVELRFHNESDLNDWVSQQRRGNALDALANHPFRDDSSLVIDADRARRDFAYFGDDDLRQMNSTRLVSRVFTEATVMMDQLHRVAADAELSAIYAVQQIENIAPDAETATALLGDLSETTDSTTVRRAIDLKRAELMAANGDVEAALDLYSSIVRGEK